MCQDVFKREVEREKPFDFYIYKSRKAYQDDLQAQKKRKKSSRGERARVKANLS